MLNQRKANESSIERRKKFIEDLIYFDRWLPSYSTFEDFANLYSNEVKEWKRPDGEQHRNVREVLAVLLMGAAHVEHEVAALVA